MQVLPMPCNGIFHSAFHSRSHHCFDKNRYSIGTFSQWSKIQLSEHSFRLYHLHFNKSQNMSSCIELYQVQLIACSYQMQRKSFRQILQCITFGLYIFLGFYILNRGTLKKWLFRKTFAIINILLVYSVFIKEAVGRGCCI